MKLCFIELAPFERSRSRYLSDAEYMRLQFSLLESPQQGSVIPGSGGLRKLRLADVGHGKGKRGGLRVIYHFAESQSILTLCMLYRKGEMLGLTPNQLSTLRKLFNPLPN